MCIRDSYTFKRGVKAITQETKWDRALPIFRRFLRSMLDTDEQLYAHLKHAEEHGFRSVRVGIWTDDFAAWKIGHKSEQAKASRAAGVKKQQSKRAKRPLPRKKK